MTRAGYAALLHDVADLAERDVSICGPLSDGGRAALCAQRELHRQPGVRIGELVAEESAQLVDPVADGLRVHVEAGGDLVVRAPGLQPDEQSARHAIALLGREARERGLGLLPQLVGEEGDRRSSSVARWSRHHVTLPGGSVPGTAPARAGAGPELRGNGAPSEGGTGGPTAARLSADQVGDDLPVVPGVGEHHARRALETDKGMPVLAHETVQVAAALHGDRHDPVRNGPAGRVRGSAQPFVCDRFGREDGARSRRRACSRASAALARAAVSACRYPSRAAAAASSTEAKLARDDEQRLRGQAGGPALGAELLPRRARSGS